MTRTGRAAEGEEDGDGGMGAHPHRVLDPRMQMAFYSIPARGDAGLQEDLNRFLRSHRVLTVHREFVGQGDNSFWALAVEYMDGVAQSSPAPGRPGKERVDYKEVLSPADFALFVRLRDWRKATADKEGIPVYAVLTNEQLAAIATKRPTSPSQLREIDGVGEAKAGKYGPLVMEIVATPGGPTSVSASDGPEPVPPSHPSGAL